MTVIGGRMLDLRQVRRVFDTKPWAAHLYVTEQCNLDCHYCNEFNNSIPHPALADLKEWMDHIRKLDVMRLGLKGGEPLKHPDIVEGVRYEKSVRFFEHQEKLKRSGQKIHSTWNLFAYQKKMLRQEPVEWTCIAGYKYFFVSSTGKFWLCSQVRTERHILEITREDLLSYNRKKDCQAGCGVYCTAAASLAGTPALRYAGREGAGVRADGAPGSRARRAAAVCAVALAPLKRD